MKRLLKEPLLHFLLLGAGLFVAYTFVSLPGNNAPEEIIVTAGQIEHMAANFAKAWQRSPSSEEIKGLLDDWVREEIATREAIKLGLDQDDTIIRRRLRQKLEFISQDLAAVSEPTEDDLNTFLQAHPELFRIEPHFTFTQVYFDSAKHGDHLTQDIEQVLAQLNQIENKPDSAVLGDSLLLDHSFQSTPKGEIEKQFGETFAAALDGLSPGGEWQGPIESGYGVHLVLLSERTEGSLPELAEARDDVLREWENAHRHEANEKFYQELLKRYTVTIEGLDSIDGQKSADK